MSEALENSEFLVKMAKNFDAVQASQEYIIDKIDSVDSKLAKIDEVDVRASAIASTSTLGRVKVDGRSINIDANGAISSSDIILPNYNNVSATSVGELGNAAVKNTVDANTLVVSGCYYCTNCTEALNYPLTENCFVRVMSNGTKIEQIVHAETTEAIFRRKSSDSGSTWGDWSTYIPVVNEVYVDASVTASGDGKTAATAFKTIAEGVAALSGGTKSATQILHIASGTYDEGAVFSYGYNLTTLRIYISGTVVVNSATFGSVYAYMYAEPNSENAVFRAATGNVVIGYGARFTTAATVTLSTLASALVVQENSTFIARGPVNIATSANGIGIQASDNSLAVLANTVTINVNNVNRSSNSITGALYATASYIEVSGALTINMTNCTNGYAVSAHVDGNIYISSAANINVSGGSITGGVLALRSSSITIAAAVTFTLTNSAVISIVLQARFKSLLNVVSSTVTITGGSIQYVVQSTESSLCSLVAISCTSIVQTNLFRAYMVSSLTVSGAVTANALNCTSVACNCSDNSYMSFSGAISLSGVVKGQVFAATNCSTIIMSVNKTLNVTGPTYTDGRSATVYSASNSFVRDHGGSYTSGSSAVGRMRYSASANGIIWTNGKGANYIPGDTAGAVATNGQYL